MKQKITILITFVIGFTLFCVQLNEVRTEASLPNFLTYTNTEHGFTIKYPSDWRVDETTAPAITFRAPDNSAKVAVNTIGGISAEDLFKSLESQSINSNVSRITELDNKTYFLSGHPAIRWVGLWDVLYPDNTTDEYKIMGYATDVGNDLLDVEYSSFPDKFSDFLSTAQTMIDSLQILGK